MDHRGRVYDNIFIERSWHTVKYENVCLQEYESPREACIGTNEYTKYYNERQLHQSLYYNTHRIISYIG